MAEVRTWGAGSLLGSWAASSPGASGPRAGGPVLPVTASLSRGLALVGLPFPAKVGVAITRRAQTPLFAGSPAPGRSRTPFLNFFLHQPQIQELWMDPEENTPFL